MPHVAYHARDPFIVKQQENDGLLNFDQRALAAIFETHPTNVPDSGEHSAES